MISENCQVQDTVQEGRGTCYHLNTQGPCKSGILAIDEVLLEPVCLLQTETHSIFILPNPRGCPRGSIRDSQGRCRVNVSEIFGNTPPIVTSRPGTADGRLCPKGQLFLGGLCHRLSLRRGPKRDQRPRQRPTSTTAPQSSSSSSPWTSLILSLHFVLKVLHSKKNYHEFSFLFYMQSCSLTMPLAFGGTKFRPLITLMMGKDVCSSR